MRGLGISLVLTAVLSVSGATAADDPKNDHERLEGTWKVVSSVIDGQPVPAERLKDMRVIHGHHKDGKHEFAVKKGDEVQSRGVVTHEEDKKPKVFDVTYTEGLNKGKTFHGIYEVEGDTLKLCWSMMGEDHPKEFASKAGSKTTLRVYKKESEKEKP